MANEQELLKKMDLTVGRRGVFKTMDYLSPTTVEMK